MMPIGTCFVKTLCQRVIKNMSSEAASVWLWGWGVCIGNVFRSSLDQLDNFDRLVLNLYDFNDAVVDFQGHACLRDVSQFFQQQPVQGFGAVERKIQTQVLVDVA